MSEYYIFRYTAVVFQNAIDKGYLSKHSAKEWAYIGSKDCGDETPEVIDAFKNSKTGEYLHVAA